MPWGALAGPVIPRRSPASPVPRPARCGADTQHVTWVALWLLDRDPARGPEVLRCFPPDRPGSPTPPELSWAARCPPSSCGLNRRGPPAPGAAGRPGTWPRLGLRAPLLPDRGPPWERWEAGWGGAMLPPSQTRAGDRARHKQMGTPAAAGSCTPPPLGEPPASPGPRPPGCKARWTYESDSSHRMQVWLVVPWRERGGVRATCPPKAPGRACPQVSPPAGAPPAPFPPSSPQQAVLQEQQTEARSRAGWPHAAPVPSLSRNGQQ